jgi:hypothetical protein
VSKARLTYPKDPVRRNAVRHADYIGGWADMVAEHGYGLLVEVGGALYPIADLVIRPRHDGGMSDLCIIV